MPNLICWLGTPEIATDYGADYLDLADKIRLVNNPKLAEKLDWRVSRALKQRVNLPIKSLSHSAGYAAILTADANWVCGVDLEVMRERDFAALADWICDTDEFAYLQQKSFQAAEFYRLWCVKEALIKAANLNFPADMPRVGYKIVNCKIGGIRVENQLDWHGLTAIVHENFMLAMVWQTNKAA